MMSEKRRNYTAEFKREAVALITEHGYGVSEAARNLGINANMLRKWKRKLEENVTDAFPGKGHLSAEQEEFQRLRQENKRLRMERDILKKAAIFFANESS
jgi:transposase